MLQQLFVDVYRDFSFKGYFQKSLGYECVDSGEVYGEIGPFIDRYVFRKLKKDHLWPIGLNQSSLSEADIFDLIEFFFDHVAKGVDGYNHTHDDCGWHYKKFDVPQGQRDFAVAVNDILSEYRDGFALSTAGEVVTLAPAGLAALEDTSVPVLDDDNVSQKVQAAVHKFRRRGAKASERKDAIRDLADVLEFLRPEAKKVLHKRDEADLFELANRFGIRHHNPDQKAQYDQAIWFSWMFYHFLATIHALTRLIERSRKAPASK
jgi:hypothetical protein